jgi:hypothetical protein
MNFKITTIVFVLSMAMTMMLSAQNDATGTAATSKQKTQVSDQPVNKVAPVNQDKNATAGSCCKGQQQSGCTGHKDGEKPCCKDGKKSDTCCKDGKKHDGCTGNKGGEAKAAGCQGHNQGENKASGCTGQHKSGEGCKGHTNATGQQGETKQSKGCCNK